MNDEETKCDTNQSIENNNEDNNQKKKERKRTCLPIE